MIGLVCVLFYCGVFGLLKYGRELMVEKYNVDGELGGSIGRVLGLGSLLVSGVLGNV